MGEHLQRFQVLTVLSVILGLLMCQSSAQNPFLSGTINTATGRSINGGAFVQSNFDQNEKNAFKNKIAFTTQANFETTKPNFDTTKPLPFVIPSYASGILDKKSTIPSPRLTSPSELLQPPVGQNGNVAVTQSSFQVTQPSFGFQQNRDIFNGIPTTTLNSFDAAETTTLLPVTQQRFGAFPVTQRSNFNAYAQDITTNQPKPNLFTQKATIPQTTFNQFGAKVTTPIQTSSSTIKSTTAFTNFEKVTTTPAFGFGFANARDEILGNQQPGYAVKPDGSIDSNAVPPQFRNQFTTTQFTRAISSSTLKLFETTPTTTPTTTQKFFTQPSKNFTHNQWLNQQTTPFAQNTQIQKQNPKPFVPSVTNPFLASTTPAQLPTTTNFQFDTTTPVFQKPIVGGIRDRIPIITTTLAPKLDTRGQFTNNPKSTQFNTIQPTNGPKSTQFNSFQSTNGPKSTQFNTFPSTTTFSPITRSFNNFAQKSPSPVTQSTTFTGFNNNKNIVTQTTTPKQSITNQLPNGPSGLVIQVPDSDVLPPFLDGDQSTKFPAALQTTKTTANTQTTLPQTRAPITTTTTTTTTTTSTTIKTVPTTRAPAQVQTFPPTITPNAFEIRQNQPSTVVNKPNQDLLPPVDTTTSTITVHKSPAISLPSDDLLPPVATNAKPNVDTSTTETKPNDFLPQLDLNPFLAPFLGSRNGVATPSNAAPAAAAAATKTTSMTTTTTTNRPTANAGQAPLADSPFDYKKPANPFVFQANFNDGSQQQPQQPRQPPQQQINTKYTGGFGAPPGILSPYDNQRN